MSKKIYEICELCQGLIDYRISLRLVGYHYFFKDEIIIYHKTVCPSCCFKKSEYYKSIINV